jgi:hypothetical protein
VVAGGQFGRGERAALVMDRIAVWFFALLKMA